MSRYKTCIVTEVFSLARIRLQYKILYCDSGLGRRWARAGAQAALAWGARQRAASARGRHRRTGERGRCAAALERRDAQAAGAQGGRRTGRQARGAVGSAAGHAERAGQGWLGGLGARAGQRLCTRPVFGPV